MTKKRSLSSKLLSKRPNHFTTSLRPSSSTSSTCSSSSPKRKSSGLPSSLLRELGVSPVPPIKSSSLPTSKKKAHKSTSSSSSSSSSSSLSSSSNSNSSSTSSLDSHSLSVHFPSSPKDEVDQDILYYSQKLKLDTKKGWSSNALTQFEEDGLDELFKAYVK